uniref:Uncharacterized protein n=1 Tax=Anguilla anguilla TaxID=7936 RepID=A0A0E9SP05_ANGAN
MPNTLVCNIKSLVCFEMALYVKYNTFFGQFLVRNL